MVHLRFVHFTVNKLFLNKKFQSKCKMINIVRSPSEAFMCNNTCEAQYLY